MKKTLLLLVGLTIFGGVFTQSFPTVEYFAPSVLAAKDDKSNNPPESTNVNCGDNGVKLGTKIGGSKCVGSNNQNPIFDYLARILNFLSVIFGLLLVLVLIYAGIKYITSGGSPDETKDAKNRIKAALTGFLLFILMYAILNLLIPGGLLR